MARTHSRLAKLTRPDAAGLLLRERLFALLDRTQRGQFAWISGAGGAGKTSLVSSWLDQRGHNALWYRVDTADRDPATFFHYLGLAVAGQARPLPHFTPEYLAGLSDFARRYFRDFFARVRAPCVVVFDNCHEAGADSPLESILAWALEEAPSGVAIVGVSRKDPGEPFARSIADARFVHITTQDLALDEGEARDIAKARGQDQSDVSALLAQVDGWAAGFIMMLRAHARTVETHDAFIDGQHAIFNYFAAEILAAGGGRLRDFLLRTAVLPIVSPSLAKRLTGFSESAALLADLHFGHFFTERRSRVRDEPLYEYHPLFREFLIAQARQTLGTEAFATHCRQAAALLDETGRMEAAVALRIMAADWSALVKAISTHASVLMGQGRWQTLREWIEAVPHAVAEAQPWVLYWRGICAYMVNPAVGRTDLEAAYHQFQAAGESMGSLLACAGVLEAGYLEFADQKASLPWVDEINRLLAASPPMPPEVEMRVIQSLLGVWMAQPQHPLVARWAARAAQLLRTFPDARGGAGLIAFAAAYCVWAGDYVGARAIVNQFDLDRRAIEGDPLSALTLCAMRAGVGWQNGDHEEAYAMIRLAQEIADNSGVHVLDSFILAQAVYTALSARDLPQAEHEIGRLRAQLIPPQARRRTIRILGRRRRAPRRQDSRCDGNDGPRDSRLRSARCAICHRHVSHPVRPNSRIGRPSRGRGRAASRSARICAIDAKPHPGVSEPAHHRVGVFSRRRCDRRSGSAPRRPRYRPYAELHELPSIVDTRDDARDFLAGSRRGHRIRLRTAIHSQAQARARPPRHFELAVGHPHLHPGPVRDPQGWSCTAIDREGATAGAGSAQGSHRPWPAWRGRRGAGGAALASSRGRRRPRRATRCTPSAAQALGRRAGRDRFRRQGVAQPRLVLGRCLCVRAGHGCSATDARG